jgi:hypothetical protein
VSLGCTKEFFQRTAFAAAVVLACLSETPGPAHSQQSGKPATEQWRPKDGIYATPGKDFEQDCNEAGYIVIDLAERSVSGYEWSCEIGKSTNTALDAVKIEMTCSDYNLAESLYPNDPSAAERKIKEVMMLKRIDNEAMSIRKTVNGKFTNAPRRSNYCPEQVQRRYVDGKAEAKQIAIEEKIKRNPWRPNAGIYAGAGADFSERCLNGGETIIDLGERLVSSGNDKCSVIQIRDELHALKIFVDCNTPPRPETIILRKLDDKTVLLQKTKNRNFSDPGEQLSYCGPATQAMYAQQKGKK